MLRLPSIILFFSLSATGCFFTDPINDRPVARISIENDPPFHKGSTVMFDAAKSVDDDADDDLRAHWRAFACSSASPPICEPLVDSVTKENLVDAFELDIPMDLSLDTMATINVELRVEDDSGASGLAIESIVIENRIPTINVSLDEGPNQRPGGGPVLGLPVSLTAEPVDEDGDEPVLSWDFEGPPTSLRASVVFNQIGPNTYELDADVPGGWKFLLSADDGVGGVGEREVTFDVSADLEPCIQATDPVAVDGASYIVERSDGPRRFAVLHVVDELDVFPLADGLHPAIEQTRFSWKIATPDTNGALVPLSGHVVSDYVLDPSAFSPGDLVELQVEASDRVTRDACDSAQTVCSSSILPNCFQRLTWGVEIR